MAGLVGHVTGVVDTSSGFWVPRSILGLMIPVPVSVEVTLWSDNLLSLVDNSLLMIVSGSWVVDTGSSNLMLVVWNDGGGLPDWVVDGGQRSGNPTSRDWSNWVNADSRSTSWLWALASSDGGICEIVSKRNVVSSWLSVNRVFKIWLAFISGEEIAPVSAVRKFNPSGSNA